jgi:hypothetical protein
MKLSQLYGKPLLSLYSASTEGVITGVLFSSNLRRAYAVKIDVSKKGDVPNKYCPLNKVHSFSDFAVTVKNSSCLTAAAPDCIEALGVSVVDTNGNDLGKIAEIETQKTVVSKIITPKVAFSPAQLVAFNEFAVVNLTGKKINFAPVFPRMPRSTQPVATVNVGVPAPLGEKRSTYSFLEGKALSIGFILGSKVLKKGEIITKENIAAAEKEGKLISLALACR